MTQTVSLSFFRFAGLGPKLWAFGMMGAARLLLPRVPDVGFWKLCGSGTGEGFTPIPNTAVYAILCTWPDAATAKARVEDEAFFGRYRKMAVESWSVYLTPTQSRGRWAGKEPFTPQGGGGAGSGGSGSGFEGDLEAPVGPQARSALPEQTHQPLAALTRATIKPSMALRFWRRVPDISRVIGLDENVAFKIGIGEVPWFHQITFSIWPSADAMATFARRDGPHARAIRAVRAGAWFREELYARFQISGDHGAWGGDSPLRRLAAQTRPPARSGASRPPCGKEET